MIARHAASLLVVLAFAGVAAGQEGAPPADGPASFVPETPSPATPWTTLPDGLARVLEAKSLAYQRRALKFSCRETIREAEYSGGEATREKVREFDYLLIEEPTTQEGFTALRTRPGTNDVVSYVPEFPEPYGWTAVFGPKIRSLLRFQVGDWHTTPWRLAIPIAWVSSAPVIEKRRVTEWSGTAEVEYRTGNMVLVTARPSLQDERIQMELDRYQQAFRFIGIPFAPPPIGLQLTVHFEEEHGGFTYPSRIELVTFQQVHDDERRILTRQTIEYSNYRFFGTAVEDRIPPLTWRPPETTPKM